MPPLSDAVFIAALTTVVGAISGVVGALWRRLEALDARGDQLLRENGELRGQVAQLQLDLQTERESRERERQEHRQRIRRLEDENRILRGALRSNGIHVEESTSGD